MKISLNCIIKITMSIFVDKIVLLFGFFSLFMYKHLFRPSKKKSGLLSYLLTTRFI